jgi:hypothetical protein
MALSEEAQLGNWQVQVQVEAAVFTAELNVSLADGMSGLTMPEVAMAEEHYVELRFGHEMRRLYKPGLPFVGKVCSLNRSLYYQTNYHYNHQRDSLQAYLLVHWLAFGSGLNSCP